MSSYSSMMSSEQTDNKSSIVQEFNNRIEHLESEIGRLNEELVCLRRTVGSTLYEDVNNTNKKENNNNRTRDHTTSFQKSVLFTDACKFKHLSIDKPHIEKNNRLGFGCYGEVYKGMLEEPVAIKILRNCDKIEYIRREVDAMMRASGSPHVVSIKGVYENFDEYNRLEIGIVMPFMSRGSLMGICYNNKLLPYEMKVKFAYEAALGVKYLHEKNIIHRDISCRNFLVNDYLHIYVTDFGFSRLKRNDTNGGIADADAGPLRWEAPECFQNSDGRKVYSEKTDSFSYAVSLYEILFGEKPWKDVIDHAAVAIKVLRGERMKIPSESTSFLANLMVACWNQYPENRPDFNQIVSEFAHTAIHERKPSKYMKERDVAVRAVELASTVCRRVFESLDRDGPQVNVKQDKSPVTIADYASQVIMIETIRREFPRSLFVGEEDSSMLRQQSSKAMCDEVISLVHTVYSDMTKDEILNCIDMGSHGGGGQGSFWVLDPIDGTKGFLDGTQYAICLGLVSGGKAVLGVLGCPNYTPMETKRSTTQVSCGSLFVAVDGQGAHMRNLQFHDASQWKHDCDDSFDEYPIVVSIVRNNADVVFCESLEPSHSDHNVSSEIASALNISEQPQRMHSQCKYAAVACGFLSKVDVYLRPPLCLSNTNPSSHRHENIWDHVAGAVIVTEAGGYVTDMLGRALDFSSGRTLQNNIGVCCSSSHWLHDSIIEVAKRKLAPHHR